MLKSTLEVRSAVSLLVEFVSEKTAVALLFAFKLQFEMVYLSFDDKIWLLIMIWHHYPAVRFTSISEASN